MVYFFHHYELPTILQQAHLQVLLQRNQHGGLQGRRRINVNVAQRNMNPPNPHLVGRQPAPNGVPDREAETETTPPGTDGAASPTPGRGQTQGANPPNSGVPRPFSSAILISRIYQHLSPTQNNLPHAQTSTEDEGAINTNRTVPPDETAPPSDSLVVGHASSGVVSNNANLNRILSEATESNISALSNDGQERIDSKQPSGTLGESSAMTSPGSSLASLETAAQTQAPREELTPQKTTSGTEV